jgi:UDP-N-acetylmuramoylalanine--D-glutamate ligase
MRVAGVELRGARVAVVGLEKSGLAAIALLRREGAEVTASDIKAFEDLPAAARAALDGLRFVRQEDGPAAGQDLVVLSPGVPPGLEVFRGARVIGDLELASYFLLGRTIAITGSNGKTTTTAMTGHVLRECGVACQVGGNIGVPPAAMVESSRPDQWNVIEVSSFQAETLSRFSAAIAVCLNVTPDHLDRHGTFEAYAAAKGRLFSTQKPDAYAVLNADDATCVRYASQTPARTVWFSHDRAVTPGLWVRGGRIVMDDDPVMEVSAIPLRGRHNVENTLAAAGACRLAGAPIARIGAAVSTFPGVEHRIEFVRGRRGVSYYNDSKATNVDAALKAVESFEAKLWIILGGKDKGGDYRLLIEPLKRRGAVVLLVGAAAGLIEDHLAGALPVVRAGTVAAAVEHAAAEAAPGDVVLLAPACASFDQFENYEHRGRVFKELVRGLPE